LEGIFKGYLAQPPCSERGHLQPDQAAQSPVQHGLKCFQGWGIDHFPGQPVPGLQNHRMFGVGRDLCGSSSPTPLLKQGHLEQAAQDLVQVGLVKNFFLI